MSTYISISQVVGGVRCLGTALLLAHLQVVLLDDVVEAIVSHAVPIAKLALVHLPELATANAMVLLAHTLDKLHAERLFGKLTQITITMLIVGLRGNTKQFTLRLDRICLRVASVKPTDYLVPAFFKSMPYTSLPKATISS